MRIKLLFILLFSSVVFSQSIPLSKNAQVSVLTCGLGPEVYALFGHTAIRVNDPENSIDIVYNYGAFDFRTPHFALKFARGDLQYFATSGTYADFVMQYNLEQRSVYEQVLNVSQNQKQELFERLNQVLFSSERFYTYKFIDRNCTNMAVDILNKTLGGKVIYKQKDVETTYRSTLFPYFHGHFFEQLGTQILFGTKVDEKATLLFLPFELKKSLELTQFNGKPLTQPSKTILQFEKQFGFSWWNNLYVLLLLVAVVILANRNGISMAYLSIVGVVGLLFCFTMAYSLHEELKNNYNILLFNPLFFLAVYFQLRNNTKWLYRLSLVCVALLGIYLVVMVNKAHLIAVMPILFGNLVVLGRWAIRSSKALAA